MQHVAHRGSDPAERKDRRLKVYGGNLDGVRRAIMAAHSYKEFKAATGIGSDYGCETGDIEEIAQALTAPDTVFVRRHHAREQQPWIEWKRGDA